FLFVLVPSGVAHAEYFSAQSFETYVANGSYPFWSKTWVGLERRVYRDADGIPYVDYSTGKSYNVTTISLFGLLAYDRYLGSRSDQDKNEFLNLADWIAANQDQKCGCWSHDFDFTHAALGESIRKPWVSAMTQGLGISMMTRAYVLTRNESYLRAAELALRPF